MNRLEELELTEEERKREKVELLLDRYRSIKINDAKKEDRAYWVLETFDYDRAELIEDELAGRKGPLLDLLQGILPGRTREDRARAVGLFDELMAMSIETMRAMIRKNSELGLGQGSETQ